MCQATHAIAALCSERHKMPLTSVDMDGTCVSAERLRKMVGQRRLKGDRVTEKDGGTEKVKGRHGD